ncbi:hypothetical protein LTR66_003762 [Elasticomyces elasticus]|nr:hypothetical protein LTR28_004599 [Elasticomyces elasticus]KAK4991410.1 hypothetical protein LTR50_001802 [Elasticomyces elasticus]KAK4996676.1 hypothetical protein LTR66_003762 [Elasticomyces elasticus]
MSMTTHTAHPTSSFPLSVPSKPAVRAYHPHHYNQSSAYSRASTSPPERPDSTTTGPAFSATSSSYAGSSNDFEQSSGGLASVDLLEYMNDRLAGAFDPLPLDRSLVKQAQTSGELNAKTRELLELQALAKSRLASARANFADGIKAAKEVQRGLEWTQKRVK